MYYVDYESSMEKGSFYVDHSKHFYNGRLGYEWTSKDFAGKLHKRENSIKGLSVTRKGRWQSLSEWHLNTKKGGKSNAANHGEISRGM